MLPENDAKVQEHLGRACEVCRILYDREEEAHCTPSHGRKSSVGSSC